MQVIRFVLKVSTLNCNTINTVKILGETTEHLQTLNTISLIKTYITQLTTRQVTWHGLRSVCTKFILKILLWIFRPENINKTYRTFMPSGCFPRTDPGYTLYCYCTIIFVRGHTALTHNNELYQW